MLLWNTHLECSKNLYTRVNRRGGCYLNTHPNTTPNTPPDTQPSGSGCFQGNHLVIRLVSVRLTFEAKFLHRQSQMDLRTVIVLDRRILTTNQVHQLTAFHTDALLTLLRLTDTGLNHFSNILLLHVVQVQFPSFPLYSGHPYLRRESLFLFVSKSQLINSHFPKSVLSIKPYIHKSPNAGMNKRNKGCKVISPFAVHTFR